jgi:UDP-N-acetylmuramoyl-L-alanyl-D-glutamate--2,6-diaminopimelate ligase
MKLKELFSNIYGVNIIGDENEDVRGIAYHSKKVEKGYLFVALKGQKTDGNRYIMEAIDRGARAILSEENPQSNFPVTWVKAEEARKVLALISAKFYDFPSKKINVIGITGTNGKTSVTFILENIFLKTGFPTGVIGTINYRYSGKEYSSTLTTPEAPDLQRILKEMKDNGVIYCFMEVSSHSLALDRVLGIVFRAGVFTNLSGDHLDFHKDMEDYYQAKKKLFIPENNNMKAVINIDDPWGERLRKEISIGYISYGFKEGADIKVEKYKLMEEGIDALIKTPKGEIEIRSPLLGRPYLYNILASIGVSMIFNVPVEKIKEGIASIRQIPGRMEKVENKHGINVIIDYAHSDDSLKNLLKTVNQIKGGKIILVFGAGGDRDRSKRPRMGEVAGRLSDFSIITSDNPRSEDPIKIIEEIEKGFKKIQKKNYTIIPDRREAICKAINMAQKGDWVLIAGKGHENYQIIKDKIIPFNDKEVASQFLNEKNG